MMTDFLKKHGVRIILAALFLVAIFTFISLYYTSVQYDDNDPHRGAVLIDKTSFNDGFDKVYPSPDFDDWQSAETWQGWTPQQSMWYYNATQGSDLLPYDFFLELEQIGSKELFRSVQNVDKYRYIAQKKTNSNPDGLPLGFVKDEYKGKAYLGFTCAACHASQIVYNRVAIRVDGAPSMADMVSFMIALQKSVEHTLTTPEKLSSFSKKILARGNFDSTQQVKTMLQDTATNLMLYNEINHSETDYGYARLDAFGRIFNRVLQHILNKEDIHRLLKEVFDPVQADNIITKINSNIISSKEFDHLFQRIQPFLSMAQQGKLRDTIFNPPDAPVSYPFLWDTPQHDYVQWNGIADNAGVGPIGRNAGEVLGVFGTLDWHEESDPSWFQELLLKAGGQSKQENGKYVNFESSVDVTNLRLIEDQLKSLHSPLWPETVLPKIDQGLAKTGEPIFNNYCASCHLPIDRKAPTRRVIGQFDKLSDIGTDPKMAMNSVTAQGASGILQGNYVGVGPGSLYLQQQMPVATLLTSAVKNVVLTPDPDKLFFEGWFVWISNLLKSKSDNKVKSSLKQGTHELVTAIAPYADLTAYKGRPLNGIWATAPYLHNGSVPTLYDLFLPKKRYGDPAVGEYRPDEFWIGSRQFDPVKVGFMNKAEQGSLFNTQLSANGNEGHEYAAGRTAQRDGTVLPALDNSQRMALVEYLKTL
jgi:hypothetical protein